MATKNNEYKKWYESKTLWTVIITAVVMIAQSSGVDFPEWLIPSLLSAGLIFDRAGTKKIK